MNNTKVHGLPASPARTARSWPSYFLERATSSTASSDALPHSTPNASIISIRIGTVKTFASSSITAISSTPNLIRIIQECQPAKIYNLAAQSHVPVSFELPNTPPTPTASAPSGCSGHPYFETGDRNVGALRPGSGGSATGNDAVLSSLPARRGETLRLLDHRELPGGPWIARLERNSVQS